MYRPVHEWKLEDLELSRRTINACTKAGIRTLRDLLRVVFSGEFAKVRGVGPATIREVKGLIDEILGDLLLLDKWALRRMTSVELLEWIVERVKAGGFCAHEWQENAPDVFHCDRCGARI